MLCAFDQGSAAFVEERPGFFVGFVAVAVFLEGLDGVEHDSLFAFCAEEQGGGDDVPGFDRDDPSTSLRTGSGGEEIELGESVVLLFEVVRFELAEVSGAGAAGGGLDPFGRCRSLRAGFARAGSSGRGRCRRRRDEFLPRA